MQAAQKNIETVATNPWFIVVSAIASIASFAWLLYDKAKENVPWISTIVLFVSLILLVVGYVFSLKVRGENIALRGLSEIFCEINKLYRDKLRESFAKEDPSYDPVDLAAEEKSVLQAVCQRIENIFSRVTGRNCMVTIKLLTKENGKVFAETYVRSQQLCDRDNPCQLKYSVGTGKNTSFDEAAKKRADGRPQHYFSPNLLKENGYSNERQHYDRFYKSTLVVPILGINRGKEETPEEFDHVGFLCVDTLAVNHLNDGYHLYMLSALATQMYNFMSLMRGKYTVLVG